VDGILIGKDLAAKAPRRDQRLGLVDDGRDALTRGPATAHAPAAGSWASSASACFELDSTTAFLSLDVARRLLGKDQVDLIQLRVDDIYAAPQIAASIPSTLGSQYITADWAAMNQVAVLGARAREDGHLAHHRPHRHGGGAQHHRLADPARDGKASRHRDPQDHGRQRAQRDHDFS